MTAVIDVWIQHPSSALMNHPMFESFRAWSHGFIMLLHNATRTVVNW